MSVSRRIWIIATLVAVLLPATAHGVSGVDQTLFVTFRPGPQRITVTLANGTQVGTTSGPPTVIPPGLYTVSMDDSAGVTGPELDLRGPGVSLLENMFYGEIQAATFSAVFQPNATYTWRNTEQPSVVFTFATSADTGGGSGSTGTTPAVTTTKKGTPAPSIVGSAIIPFRGKLAATVDGAGKLALAIKGKPVGTLRTGLYTFTVVDKSAKSGFAIQKLKASALTLTGIAYKGTHVATINLKAGQWTFFSPGGKRNYFIVVA